MDNLNPDLTKVKELALKLKEMADRGTEHERVVAEKKLSSLLKKYGLTIDDINKNKTKVRYFSFNNEDETKVMAHVIWSVAPNVNINRTNKQKKAYCELTPEQYIEIKEKIKFYLDDFSNQKRSFTIGYILKNNLDVKPSLELTDSIDKSKYECKSNIDNEAVGKMMFGMRKVDFESVKTKKQIK